MPLRRRYAPKMGRGCGRQPRSGILCTLALAVAALAFLPATATPRKHSKLPKPPPNEFFGVQAIAPPTLGELGALRAGRIGTLRETFFWPAVERTPGARRWLGVDYAVGQAANHGIRVLPILYGTPPHLGASFSDPPIHSTEARTAWALYVGDAVRRYGPGGSFWQQYPGVPYLPVTHWQVWNEPNGTVFWNGQPSPWAYADLVKLASGAIR